MAPPGMRVGPVCVFGGWQWGLVGQGAAGWHLLFLERCVHRTQRVPWAQMSPCL